VKSTKQKVIVGEDPDGVELTQAITSKQNILVKVFNANETVFTDQTGRFPVQSSRVVEKHCSWCTTTSMQIFGPSVDCCVSKTMGATNRGWKNKPNLHILDNEASEAFKAAI
jgi:hypothetical protein